MKREREIERGLIETESVNREAAEAEKSDMRYGEREREEI